MNKESYRVIRILLIPKVVGLIAEEFGWDEIKACTAFYNSKLNEQLENGDNDLWTYSGQTGHGPVLKVRCTSVSLQLL